MKFVFILLAVVALATGREIAQTLQDSYDRSISSQVVDWIEFQKRQMPCGFPSLGIGPVAPGKLSHRDLDINAGNFAVVGEIDDFIIYGLDDFDIVEFKVNAVTSKVTFKFNWNHVYLETEYQAGIGGQSDAKRKVSRGGDAKFAIKDLEVWGTIKYSLGVVSGNLRLKEFKVYVSVGDVISEIGGLSNIGIINKKFNQIIEEFVKLSINDNTENIAELTDELVVPMVNEMIGDMSLTDLIGMIGGGDGEGAEKEECIPPEGKSIDMI